MWVSYLLHKIHSSLFNINSTWLTQRTNRYQRKHHLFLFFGHFCCKSPSLGQILDDDTEFQLISDLVVSIFSSYWIHDKINWRAEDNGSGLIQESSDWTGLCLMYKETESMINALLLLCHVFQKVHNKGATMIYVIQIQ